MNIKKFKDLTDDELNMLVDIHYNHWVQFNNKMKKEDTIYKFKELYTKEKLPFAITLVDEFNNIVGFCVFKKENLNKYPEIYPWIDDVMILEKYRGKGYGKELLKQAEKVLKEMGYNKIYLWTDQAPLFYKKLGYTFKQKVEKNEGGFGELFYKDI